MFIQQLFHSTSRSRFAAFVYPCSCYGSSRALVTSDKTPANRSFDFPLHFVEKETKVENKEYKHWLARSREFDREGKTEGHAKFPRKDLRNTEFQFIDYLKENERHVTWLRETIDSRGVPRAVKSNSNAIKLLTKLSRSLHIPEKMEQSCVPFSSRVAPARRTNEIATDRSAYNDGRSLFSQLGTVDARSAIQSAMP